MEKPEVPLQPPAKDSEFDTINNNLPCRWSVVIDCGTWDKLLEEFNTKTGAELYYIQALSMSAGVKIDLKPSSEVRQLHEVYVTDDILIRMEVAIN